MTDKVKEVAKDIAAEGIVLLRNRRNILPVKNKKIALFGIAQFNHLKAYGGVRMPDYAIGLADAFKTVGINIDEELAEIYRNWNETTGKALRNSSNFKSSCPIETPLSKDTILKVQKRGAEAAAIVISRISSENNDMH